MDKQINGRIFKNIANSFISLAALVMLAYLIYVIVTDIAIPIHRYKMILVIPVSLLSLAFCCFTVNKLIPQKISIKNLIRQLIVIAYLSICVFTALYITGQIIWFFSFLANGYEPLSVPVILGATKVLLIFAVSTLLSSVMNLRIKEGVADEVK